MKKKSKSCALLAILLTTTGLTGCVSKYSESAASRQLYQPRILVLEAGRTVPTAQGLYTPQVDEIWHSPAEFQKVERHLIDLAAALEQERQRARTK